VILWPLEILVPALIEGLDGFPGKRGLSHNLRDALRGDAGERRHHGLPDAVLFSQNDGIALVGLDFSDLAKKSGPMVAELPHFRGELFLESCELPSHGTSITEKQ